MWGCLVDEIWAGSGFWVVRGQAECCSLTPPPYTQKLTPTHISPTRHPPNSNFFLGVYITNTHIHTKNQVLRVDSPLVRGVSLFSEGLWVFFIFLLNWPHLPILTIHHHILGTHVEI
jgi:hypothetical protein